MDGPKDDLFQHLREALGGLPFFAEDLGYITPDVHALRERLNIPGMAVLQFGFGDVGSHTHLPHTFTADKVVYTGTHDNDTILGWWESGASEEERRHARSYLGPAEDGVNWAMIRCAMNSVASLCVVPLQDILGLGSEARMNMPSKARGKLGLAFSSGNASRRNWPRSSRLWSKLRTAFPPPVRSVPRKTGSPEPRTAYCLHGGTASSA